MSDGLTSAATNQSETPTGDAAQSAANYITGALAATQLYVNRGIRAENAAGGGPREDPIQAARDIYAPMLGRDRGRQASSSVAMAAWQAALPFSAQYRDAARAAGRAEDRLRVLHPDAMARYSALRTGLDPVAAMREVAPLIGREIANPQARADYAVMLGPTEGRDASSEQALRAWEASLPLREHIPEADTAASRAEDRLRELHPEAMQHFDTLRAEHSPTDAARQAARLVDPAYVSNIPDPAPAAPQQPAGPDPAPAQDAPGPATVPAQQRYTAAVNAALPPDVAAAVLADTAWPRLAEALERAEQGGANAGDLLATVAGQREIDSAKSKALVLTHRVDHHTEDTSAAAAPPTAEPQTTQPQTTEPATAEPAGATDPGEVTSAPAVDPVGEHVGLDPVSEPDQGKPAEIAARNYPVAITEATVAADVGDIAATNAAAGLNREADRLAGSALEASATPDDRSTPLIDEHHDGQVQAAGLDMQSAAVDAQAQALNEPAPARFFQPIHMTGDRSTAAPGATSTAAVAAQNFATPLNQATTATTPPAAAAARPATPPAQTTTRRQ